MSTFAVQSEKETENENERDGGIPAQTDACACIIQLLAHAFICSCLSMPCSWLMLVAIFCRYMRRFLHDNFISSSSSSSSPSFQLPMMMLCCWCSCYFCVHKYCMDYRFVCTHKMWESEPKMVVVVVVVASCCCYLASLALDLQFFILYYVWHWNQRRIHLYIIKQSTSAKE